MSQSKTQGRHTLIHVVCDECEEPNTVTVAEHPRDSKQSTLIAKVHHTVAEEHADATGHHVEVGESEGSPEEVESFAENLRRDILGEEFAEEEKPRE